MRYVKKALCLAGVITFMIGIGSAESPNLLVPVGMMAGGALLAYLTYDSQEEERW